MLTFLKGLKECIPSFLTILKHVPIAWQVLATNITLYHILVPTNITYSSLVKANINISINVGSVYVSYRKTH